MKLAHFRGAYTAERASALSGVPRSTIHYWARTGILMPTISPTRVKLWSYTDLMGLRTISWLRHRKATGEGSDIEATTMPAVRAALDALADLDLDLWTEDSGPNVMVDPNGGIHIRLPTWGPEDLAGQRPLDAELFDLVAPFATKTLRGPDLFKPRPNLRIVPGKLSGSPHIAHTRIETVAVAALSERGFSSDRIEQLYPHVSHLGLVEAVDLEHQLAANLRAAA
jgi:uncharacterized protein (DUF433 family)